MGRVGTTAGPTAEDAHRDGAPRGFAALPTWVAGSAGTVLMVGVWAIVAVADVTGGSVPTPWAVVHELGSDVTQSIYWSAIGHTFLEALAGYVIGNAVALLMASVMLVVPWFESINTQLAVLTACVPVTAVGPIVASLAAAGSRFTAVFLAALGVIFTTVIGTQAGLNSATAHQLDVIAAAGGGRLMQLRKVRIVMALPSILGALKIAAPAAFLGAILGEYFLIGVNAGLGLTLLALQAQADSAKLWALALLSAQVAGCWYLLIGVIEHFLRPVVTGVPREVRS